MSSFRNLRNGCAVTPLLCRTHEERAMDQRTQGTHQGADDDHENERLNPGHDTQGTGGAGAREQDDHDHSAAKQQPLNRTDAEQAGTQRDEKFKPEDERGIDFSE